MIKWYGLMMILCTGFVAKAQYHPAQIDKKARALYQRAQSDLDDNNMPEAMAYLDLATKADTNYFDAFAQLGSIYLQQKEYNKAEHDLGKALQIDTNYDRSLYYGYAKALAGTGDFEDALVNINRYLESSNLSDEEKKDGLTWKAHYELGWQTEQEHFPFNPVNLGDSINTPDPEYFPSLTVDGKTLVFTRNLQNTNEDFYISHLLADSQWSKAVNLGPPINTPENEGTAHISQDGRFLLFAGCNRPDGAGSCDIYYSVKTASGWSEPQNMGPAINTEFWESQPCLSPDNKDLYFVSNRPGGYGGSDIYVSHLQPNGQWGPAQNLGPNINTAGDETSPFIHADNQTLYFASNGWPGIGDMDLFYSRRNPDGTWGKPVNLGYPINTIDHDGSLFVSADGKTAYYASDKSGGFGQLDIYKFELYKAARPLQTLYVEGYVYDSATQQRLTATIDLIDISTGKIISEIATDQYGNYLVTLPVGKDYAFNVSRPGYLFYSDNFSLKNQQAYTAYHINIPLQMIRVNAEVTLKNIFYETNKYNLLPESKIELDKLVKLLQENPGMKIQVNGYTDNVGTSAANLILSQKRAEAVVDYLVSQGIDAKRLAAKGFGETHPVADNNTEEGRAQNRRTEIVVTAK